MALVLADRVLETSTSEGLSTFALAGAQTGYQTFSNGIGNGNTCYYTINGQTTEQWEVGIGTVGAGTLARTTLISSNTGSFINFVAGVKNVFVTQPASKSIYKDASGNAIPLGSASATQLDITAQGDLRLQDTTGGEYVALQAPATLAASYTLTMPVDDGTSGQALITDGSGVLSWSTSASGDVYGPASATDNAIARFDLTTGKLIQNSVVTIADTTGNMAGVGTLSSGAITSSSLTSGRVPFAGASGLIQDAAALTFDGTILSATRFAGALNGTVGATTPSTGAFTTLSASTQLNLTNASDYNLYVSGVGKNFIQGGLTLGAVTADQFAMSADGVATVAGSATPIFITYNNTATASTGPQSRRYRGTISSPLAILSGDRLSNTISAGATSSSTVSNTTSIETFATENYSATNAGSYMSFHTTTTGTIGRAERMRISGDGSISLGAAPGSESLRVTPVASAVNYLNVQGNTAGSPPALTAVGSDTNINIYYGSKGTGSHLFVNGSGQQQFVVNPTASAVNYLQVTGGATGLPVTFSAQGSDTNIQINHVSKGTGNQVFIAGTTTQFAVATTASAVNYLSATGAATGSAPSIFAGGSDTNVDIALYPQGTGVIKFGSLTANADAPITGYITIKDAGGTTRKLAVIA